ncbi:MAG TPA: thiamine phosphate synthase, partial [Thermomicrobiales bacterium]|nr:thiamine phosphate synthase [Thermomicrobiales bacterium]
MMRPDLLRLYLVADPDHAPGDLVPTIAAALAGGVTLVQLRAKRLTDREQLALAVRLREICAGQ